MRRMPIPVRINPFLAEGCPSAMYAGLARVSPGCPPDRGRLHTCYSPVRRSPAVQAETCTPLPLDLHVLSLPLAFILSQDQTLRCYLSLYLSKSFSVCLFRLPFIIFPGLTGNFLVSHFFAAPGNHHPTGDLTAVSCGIISLFSSLPVSRSFHLPSVCDSGCKITADIPLFANISKPDT